MEKRGHHKALKRTVYTPTTKANPNVPNFSPNLFYFFLNFHDSITIIFMLCFRFSPTSFGINFHFPKKLREEGKITHNTNYPNSHLFCVHSYCTPENQPS